MAENSSDKARIYDQPQGGDGSGSISLILSVIAVILAVIALILGAVSMSQKGVNNYTFDGGNSGNGGQGYNNNNDDDKIWTMSIGHDASRWEYLDEVSGQIKGFDVDLVNAVCTIANKNCRLSADLYQNCWDAAVGQGQFGGQGLYNGWYDACTAWSHSYVRSRTFQFSTPFAKTKVGVFVVKPGNPRGFDWTDIRGKTIGFIDGFVFDDFCVARETDRIQGAALPVENIVHYNGRDAMVDAIVNEEIDAAFDAKTAYDNTEIVEIVSTDISTCAVGGFSMMTRKDSRLHEWWNPAFERLMATTQYRLICQDLKDQHGHIPGPDPEDLCLGL